MSNINLAVLSDNIGLNYGNPWSVARGRITPTRLDNYLTPVQFERMAHDIFMWREAIREMEATYYPMRARTQRMFLDTWESPALKSFIDRWIELTMQRDDTIYQMKGDKMIESVDLTQAFKEQTWIQDYKEHTIEAMPFGYTLISLGDIVDDKFPNIDSIKREHIRPDGPTGPILTSMVYAVDGIRVNDHPLIRLCNHWIPTKGNGRSKCGYGWLYNVAMLEIHLRHVLEWNMDFAELYGMPIKKGSTNKTGKDKEAFRNFLANSASNSWVLLDKNMGDDIVYEHVQNAGTAWKTYENLDQRLEAKASRLILGHEDALKSSPGKLGGMQANNKDGNNINFVQSAINAKTVTVGNFLCRKMNEVFAPKMRELGAYVGSKIIRDLIPEGYKHGLKNDAEENEVRRRRNDDLFKTSTWVKNFNDAGFNPDRSQLEEWTGLKLTESSPERTIIEKRDIKTETID